MQWVNALSTQPSLELALKEVVEQAQEKLKTAQLQAVLVGQTQSTDVLPDILSGYMTKEMPHPHLALLFVSSAFTSEAARIMPLLEKWLDVDVLIGCSGGGISGAGQEIEDGPAISLTLAVLPGVDLFPFHIDGAHIPDLDAPPEHWIQLVNVSPQAKPHFILLSDGFGSHISELVQGLDFAYSTSVKVGGLASGGQSSGGNALFLKSPASTEPQLYRSGTVGVALSGNIVVDAVVAQGCRPIGQPLQVTDAQDNIILSLNEHPPLKVLQDLVSDLSPEDQRLVRNSLFIGLLMDEFKSNPEQGDFLIRVIMGIDPRIGAMAIGDRIRPGQTVQFHLRDAATSAEDLRWVLKRYRELLTGQSPVGALMFTCLGRGQYLYNEADFDTRLFQEYFGDLPLAGFFCNGEIGPVGNRTFLHGYTSAFGLFRPAY
jgi:small ligand-binding sensory domain FIST